MPIAFLSLCSVVEDIIAARPFLAMPCRNVAALSTSSDVLVAQGFEYQALLGAKKMLRSGRVKNVIVRMHARGHAAGQSELNKVGHGDFILDPSCGGISTGLALRNLVFDEMFVRVLCRKLWHCCKRVVSTSLSSRRCKRPTRKGPSSLPCCSRRLRR